jgi:hypothetical protein
MCININKPTTGFKIVVSFFEMITKFHEKQNMGLDSIPQNVINRIFIYFLSHKKRGLTMMHSFA